MFDVGHCREGAIQVRHDTVAKVAERIGEVALASREMVPGLGGSRRRRDRIGIASGCMYSKALQLTTLSPAATVLQKSLALIVEQSQQQWRRGEIAIVGQSNIYRMNRNGFFVTRRGGAATSHQLPADVCRCVLPKSCPIFFEQAENRQVVRRLSSRLVE